MVDTESRVVEVPACGAQDPDGRRAASILAAYFAVEQEQTTHRKVWGSTIVCGLTAWMGEVVGLLSVRGLVVSLIALAVLAGLSVVSEWRARRRLSALVHSYPDARARAG